MFSSLFVKVLDEIPLIKDCIEREIHRGQIPRARKTQVVPSSPELKRTDSHLKVHKRKQESFFTIESDRSATRLLYEASRDTCSGCLLLFVQDFNLCCDNFYDFTMSTQSKTFKKTD